MKTVLKNKQEREKFIENYEKWDILAKIPEINITYYMYTFENGDKFIVAQYLRPATAYINEHYAEKYSLLTTKDSSYTGNYGQKYDSFEPAGSSKSVLIDYLTKVRPQVEVYE